MSRVVHRTRYVFEDVVAPGAELQTCLQPLATRFHQLVLRPLPAVVEVTTDAFGNARHHARFEEPLTQLDIVATSDVDDLPVHELEPTPFVEQSARVPHLDACRDYAADIPTLLQRIRRDFVFDATATQLDTPLASFVAHRRGVCQDFAHFAIACLRAQHIPARFVTGYSASSATSGRTHAWVAAHVHGRWHELDPTTGRIGSLGHIAVATGRDYDDVPAVRGTLPYRGTCRITSSIAFG